MEESLSIHQARKLVLLSQRVPPTKPTGSATAATLSAIEHLGYIQIDTSRSLSARTTTLCGIGIRAMHRPSSINSSMTRWFLNTGLMPLPTSRYGTIDSACPGKVRLEEATRITGMTAMNL